MRDMRDNTDDLPENAMRVALCASRHPIPDADDSIFPQVVENPLDFDAHAIHVEAWIDENVQFLLEDSSKLYIYVTGLTPVLTTFLQTYDTFPLNARVSLMHYNRETNDYVEQEWG
tara:strand:+ start:386 stop:733 length:348 start_codon:yes stop_codon:yes gene_type:complete